MSGSRPTSPVHKRQKVDTVEDDLESTQPSTTVHDERVDCGNIKFAFADILREFSEELWDERRVMHRKEVLQTSIVKHEKAYTIIEEGLRTENLFPPGEAEKLASKIETVKKRQIDRLREDLENAVDEYDIIMDRYARKLVTCTYRAGLFHALLRSPMNKCFCKICDGKCPCLTPMVDKWGSYEPFLDFVCETCRKHE